MSDMKRMTLSICIFSAEFKPALVPSQESRRVTKVKRNVLIILFHNVCHHPLTVLKVNNKLTAQTDLQTSERWEVRNIRNIIQLRVNKTIFWSQEKILITLTLLTVCSLLFYLETFYVKQGKKMNKR